MTKCQKDKCKTIIKTFIWRIIASSISFIVIYSIYNDYAQSGLAVGINTVSKTIAYYIFERLWNKCQKKSKNILNEKNDIEFRKSKDNSDIIL